MEKKEFKAKIIETFKDSWLETTAKEEDITIEEAKHYYEAGLSELHDRIGGKVVTIVEQGYGSGVKDHFEKIDNNFVIHECLFERI